MLDIKREMAAVDRKDRDFLDNLTPDERKQFGLYLMIRWASAVSGSPELQQYYICATNERLNKNFFDIPKEHEKLNWLATTTISPGMGTQRREWLSAPKKGTANTKAEKFLANLYPQLDLDDIALLAELNDIKSLKKLAEDAGMPPAQIKKELG